MVQVVLHKIAHHYVQPAISPPQVPLPAQRARRVPFRRKVPHFARIVRRGSRRPQDHPRVFRCPPTLRREPLRRCFRLAPLRVRPPFRPLYSLITRGWTLIQILPSTEKPTRRTFIPLIG